MTFGTSDDCTYRVGSIEEQGDRIDFRVNEEPLSINSYGMYNVLNATAAFAVGEMCGVEATRIRSALSEVEPVRGRARIHRVRGMIIIDDSYNANPSSMRAALDGFVRFPGRRHVAVLGDMGELGEFSDDAHYEIGEYIGEAPVDVVYWIGESGGLVADGIRKSGASRVFQTTDTFDDLIAALGAGLKKGDVVLFKASRSAALDRVVDRLLDGIVKENS